MAAEKRRLGKLVLAHRATHVVLQLLLRGDRWVVFGTFLLRRDERLLRLLRTRDPAIFATWHQDFVFTIGYLSRWNVRRRTYPLTSASRDGGLAAAAAACMGYRQAIRGSSARGGGRALLALTRLLLRDEHASVVVVCDGPRPPARELKPGILHLAQTSGLPIWLLRSSYQRVCVLERTWARFHVPLPFTRGVVLADGPIHVPADLDRAGLERLRSEVEARLNDLADRAEAAAREAT